MTPSFPIVLPPGTTMIETTEPLDCAMLRIGTPCTNGARYVLICPASEGRHRLIPVCQMCVDDASEAIPDWLQQLEAALSSKRII